MPVEESSGSELDASKARMDEYHTFTVSDAGVTVRRRLTSKLLKRLSHQCPRWRTMPIIFEKGATNDDLEATMDVVRDVVVNVVLDNCTEISDLTPLQMAICLTHLSMENCTKVHDLFSLSRIRTLRHLNVRGVPFDSIDPLTSLNKLETLDFFMAPDPNMGTGTMRTLEPAFLQLIEFRRLHLHSSPFTSVLALQRCVHLVDLSLALCSVESLAPLTALEGLRRLDLSHTPCTELRPIAVLTALTHLWLRATHFEDYESLAPLVSLKDLGLELTPVRNVDFVAKMSALQKLSLWGCHAVEQWGGLAGATASLRELDLRDTTFSDSSLLATMPKLRWLRTDGCPLDSVAPLCRLPSLASLSLHGVAGGVTTVSPLATCTTLTSLYVTNGQFQKADLRAVESNGVCTVAGSDLGQRPQVEETGVSAEQHALATLLSTS